MKTLKIIIPVLISYLLSSIISMNFIFLSLNISNSWITISSIYVVIIGFILSFILQMENKILKKINSVLLILSMIILFLMVIDSYKNIRYNNVLTFFIIIITIIELINRNIFFRLIKI